MDYTKIKISSLDGRILTAKRIFDSFGLGIKFKSKPTESESTLYIINELHLYETTATGHKNYVFTVYDIKNKITFDFYQNAKQFKRLNHNKTVQIKEHTCYGIYDCIYIKLT